MKSIYIIPFVILAIVSCKQDPKATYNASSNKNFDLIKYRKEALKVDCVKINQNTPFIMSLDDFHKVFGQEDSVMNAPEALHPFSYHDDDDSYHMKSCKYYFKKRSIFLKEDDVIFPLLIDLASTPLTLSCDSVILNLNTTTKDVYQYFPMSTQLWKGNDGNAFGGTIAVDAAGGNQGEEMWYLIFQADRLVKISFHVQMGKPIIMDLEKARIRFNQKNYE